MRAPSGDARLCIAVVGIDRYKRDPLRNAVNDARGVLEAFEELGFESIAEPLYDDHATRAAMFDLVSHLKGELRREDSLVLFFAGHGRTVTPPIDSGPPLRKGYLVPADADQRDHTWVDLASWLPGVAALPARHILVILDSCYSGVALERDVLFRHVGAATPDGVVPSKRLSRRVLTSARDNEKASDVGPVAGHSLFAGCLLDGILGGMFKRTGESRASYLSFAAYIQDQVRAHAGEKQNPDFGTLEGDNRGELFLPLGKTIRRKRGKPVVRAIPLQVAPEEPRAPDIREIFDRSEGWMLDPALAAALDRHSAAREQGFQVLSLIAGERMATQTMWGTWAARHGYLTLRTEGSDASAAIADLLAQLPWLRCLAEARKQLAKAARIAVESIDAALDARSAHDRRQWIADVAPLDRHARVSGWLLSTLREPAASLPDLTSAPVHGGDLLAIACDLACPTAVLIHCVNPDAAWLERALGVAAVLTNYLPKRCVAVAAPDELASVVLATGRGSAISMARQGMVRLSALAQRIPGRGRRHTMQVLSDALACDPRTRGRFEMDREVTLGTGGTQMSVGLLAARARIAVELDGWHHVHDPEGYERDRIQDLRLQRSGYFVMRFLAEDVDERLASTIDQIALALASRRTQGGMS